MTEINQVPADTNLPPIKLAFIIDSKVVDILNTDERFAAIFLSNPVIIDVTERINNEEEYIMIGSTYNSDSGLFEYGENL